MISRRRAIALFAGSVAALAAPRVLAQAATRTVTDSAGRRVTIPAGIGRVFAAGPPAGVTLYTLAPDRLAGWPMPLAAAQQHYLPAKYAALPVTGRLTGRDNAAAVAALRAARPDLVIDIGSVTPAYAALADRVQARTGIPYLLLDGALAQTPLLYRRLGAWLGLEARAAILAGDAQAMLDLARQRAAWIPPARRVWVYYARRPDGLQTGIAGALDGEPLDLVGAINVAQLGGTRNLATVSPAQLRSWNPEAIVTIDRGFYHAVWQDAAWRKLAAVRARRVFLAPDGPFGWFDEPPAVNRLVGLEWLGNALYPGRFPGDLRAAAARFYRRFYHIELSRPQLDALLAAA